jgi:hypothetical protein
MEGDTRTTLWCDTAQRQPDGSYVVTMPLDKLNGNETFHVHFYGKTDQGRIKIDTGYVCDLNRQTLTWEKDAH